MSDERLHTVLAEYLEAEDAGRAPDRREFIANHPAMAAELEVFFANRDEFDSRVEPLVPTRPGSRPRNGGPWRPFWLSPNHPNDSASRRFGDYELLHEVARGGMGVVYKARHVGLGRIVGLKLILAGPLASAGDLERFRIEAKAAATLDHPNLVPTYEVGECDGQPFFTMKFVDGCSLADRLARWMDNPRAVARIIATIAHAVHYAHQRGVLHRDLKPANILLDASDAPHVTDFGLAKCLDSNSELTQSGSVLGTPSYMAPEQATGSRHAITTAVDVYSLGAILYAMVVGQPPFRAETPVETLRLVTEQDPVPPSRINRRMDRDLETICLKCLEKNPRRRYGSAEALADDLERWLDGRPIHARRIAMHERAMKWSRRKPAAAALVAVSAISTVILIGGTLWSNTRLQREIKKVGLERAKAQANFDRSEQHRIRAEDRERTGRRHLFAATMNLAHQALESGHVGQVLAMLEQQRPEPGQEDLRSFEWYYLWRQCHRAHLATIRLGDGPVRCVAFSPDGQTLLAGSTRGDIILLDASTGETRDSLRVHESAVRTLAISADGTMLASASDDGTTKLWDIADRRVRLAVPVRTHSTSTLSTAISTDRSVLASIRNGSNIGLWDTTSGEDRGTLTGDTDAINVIAISPDGRMLASGSNDYTVRLWDLDTRKSVKLGTHRYYAISVAFSPDGTTLASAGEEGFIKLWDVATRTLRESWEAHSGSIYSLAFSPDNSMLASAGEDGTVKIRRLATGNETEFAHIGPAYSVAFSPDGERMASASADGSVKLWSIRTEPELDILKGHRSIVYSVAFSPDSRTLASSGTDRHVKVWDVASGSVLNDFAENPGKIVSVLFTPDGNTLVSGGAIDPPLPGNPPVVPGTIKFWDVAGGELVASLEAHPLAAWGVAASPDGLMLASAGYTDKTVKLWDIASRRERATLRGHEHRLFCVAFAPDGKTLASGCVTNTPNEVGAIIWDAQTGEILRQLRVPWVWAIAFSPDGKTIATASAGGVVKLWDVATGIEKLTCRGHTTAVRCVRFLPDGRTVVSASDDKTVKLWDVLTGQERATFRGPEHFWSLAVSSDGRTLAAGRSDGSISLWHAATPDEVVHQSARPHE